MHITRLGLLVISLILYSAILCNASAEPQHKTSITVNYANDTTRSYTILVDKNQKQTISQMYTWTDNNPGRFSLVAYHIDDGSLVPISRSHDGNFTLDVLADSNHEITFIVKQQFEITSAYTNMTFLPASPTGDNWFDKYSNIQFVIPYVIPTDNNTRRQLAGWSQDDSDINVIPRHESGLFKSTPIHMSENHSISPEYKNQYYVNVISNFGRALGTGWYDSGAIVGISVTPGDDNTLARHAFTGWQGQVIGDGKQYFTNILVDSPKVIVANWFVDYTNLSIIIIIIIAVLVLLAIYQKRKIHAKI